MVIVLRKGKIVSPFVNVKTSLQYSLMWLIFVAAEFSAKTSSFKVTQTIVACIVHHNIKSLGDMKSISIITKFSAPFISKEEQCLFNPQLFFWSTE